MNDPKIDVNEILTNAMQDPSLFSSLDIETLLDSIENEKNDYLENKTMKMITSDIYEKVNELTLEADAKLDFCKKLIGYRYVDEVHELHKGKHVRWFRKPTKHSFTNKLTNGGIVVDIKFLDNGTHVLCMNSKHRFIQFKFDNSIIFQKLSVEEQLLLMAYEHTTG